jgi:glycosyltransferase involved in cell wall biosynthesis/GT2 family glycosyltransferase
MPANYKQNQQNKQNKQNLKINRQKTSPSTVKIAIIVRTKDRPHLLTRCLQSLVEQKRVPDEVIVVNDGGVAVDEVVSAFADLNLQLIHNTTSRGRAGAGNQGVQACQSEVIGFLDDDDRFLPDHLQRLETAMLHFDAKVVYSGCRLLQRDILGEKVVLREKAIGEFNDPYVAQRLKYENYIPLINLLIDRDLWLAVDGFDESLEMFEDWDVLLRLSALTGFYHLNRVTAEYAIWGSGQITQDRDQEQWREAYRKILAKHWLSLPMSEQLTDLAEYWRVSQERRGIMRETGEAKQELYLQLVQSNQALEQAQTQVAQLQQQHSDGVKKYEQLQADWTNKYEKLQAQHADWDKRYEQLKGEYAQLQLDWTTKYQQLQADYARLQSDWMTKYQQLQSDNAKQVTDLQAEWRRETTQLEMSQKEQITQLKTDYEQQMSHFKAEQAKMLEALAQEQTRYQQLQTVAQADLQYCQTQQEALHELSKQMAVGISQAHLENILSSQLRQVPVAMSQENQWDDYQRLVSWIRDKVQQLEEHEHHLQQQIYALDAPLQPIQRKIKQLAGTLSASFWPLAYRYVDSMKAIDKAMIDILAPTQQALLNQLKTIESVGLTSIKPHQPTLEADMPPPRKLSQVYPTFISFAGALDNLQVMESVTQLGSVPFTLEAGKVLVFTVYSALDNFCRLDIFLATYLRINTCQLRLIIRELPTKAVVRLVHIEGIEVLDNCFKRIDFEALSNSAGKTYQIELDSPDATGDSCLAVWCHAKQVSLLNSGLNNETNKTNKTNKTNETSAPNKSLVSSEITAQAAESLPAWAQRGLLDVPLTATLNMSQATHLFVITGITESTPVLRIHVWLRRLSFALQQAECYGTVVLWGQFNPGVQQYCRQHQLSTLTAPTTAFNLPDLLQWAHHLPPQRAKYFWCCELTALPPIDIVERAQEMFAAHPTAGLLVPQEKHANGTIRAGYASLVRDGLLRSHSAGAPADHPYYNYRRTIEAASSQLIIIKISLLSQLTFSALTSYRTPMYQVTEVIWQLKQQAKPSETLYQGALCYEHEQPYPTFTEEDYHHDSEYFFQRWGEHLLTHMAPFANQLELLLNPELKPTVLVIDATLPMYDEDSGSLRLFTLLKIWQSLGYRLTFFPDNLDSQFKYRYALEALGVEVFHSGYGIADALAYRQFDFAFICRVNMGQRYLPILRLLSPKTIIFYDTVDIHYIREQRQAEIEKNQQLALQAEKTKKQELANCLLADRVITITEEDARHLQSELPNLVYSVIPNIHQLPAVEMETPFSQREGLVFIGNYNHQPNDDSVYYFVKTVLPKIHERLPGVCFYVIGSHIKKEMRALASDTVKIVGWVEQVAPEFAKRRLLVSYLRYGAGMKGKLGQALSLGLPVVTTSIGAEGMGLVSGETAMIADDPEQFAEAVVSLYTDETRWQQMAYQGKEYIKRHFGTDSVRKKLQDLLIVNN